MRICFFACLLGVVIVSAVSCSQRDQDVPVVINVSDFGLVPEKDGVPALRKLLDYIEANPVDKVIFPKGTYHFHADYADEFYMTVSNNTNGLKRVAFPLMGFENLEIDGQGAEFIFHGMIVPFAIENAKGITLKHFSIDFDRPFYGQAEVVAVDPSAKTFDIRIDGEWSYEIHDQNLWVNTIGGLVNIGKNLWFDPNTRSTVYNVNQYKLDPWNHWVDDNYEAYEVQPGIVRVTNRVSALPEVGWIWVFKGNGKARKVPAFRVFNSSDLAFEQINLHHSGAMGLIGEKSKNISLKRFNVGTKQGSGRMISTTADATHFVNCKGEITFEDCVFENMLDDATNVHGIYTKITRLRDHHTIGVNLIHHEQWGFHFAGSGDTLLISDNRTFKPVQALVVESVNFINEEHLEITFTDELNEEVELDFGVENISWQANLTMKNCTVHQNRARSILISTRGKVLVEDNYFSSMMGAISIAGDMNYWFESGPVEEVVIRKNTFENHCSGGKGNHVIMVNPNIRERDQAGYYFHKNITIDSNVFKTFDRGILYAEYTDQISFTNNKILQTHTFEPLFPEYAVIKFESSRGIDVSGNQYHWDTKADIEADSASFHDMKFEGNQGFEPRVKVVNTLSDYEIQ